MCLTCACAQDVFVRQSRVSSPHSRPDTPSDPRAAQQHSSGGTVGAAPAARMMPVGVDMPQPRPLQVPQMPAHLSYGFHSVSPPSGPLQVGNAQGWGWAGGRLTMTSQPHSLRGLSLTRSHLKHRPCRPLLA